MQVRKQGLSRSIVIHLAGVAVAAVLLIAGIGLLAAATELSGAVVSSGVVVVESNVKKVQHPTGGVVREVLVKDGVAVAAGDVVIRLDEAVANANLAAVSKAYAELQARHARLEAERSNSDGIAFPDELLQRDDPSIRSMVEGERRFLELRRASAANRKNQLRNRIVQLQDEIVGLTDQLTAKQKELELIEKELAGVETLWQQQLVPISRFAALQREGARLLGESGRLKSSLAQTRGKIAETELQILQIDDDARRDVAKEIADVRAKLEEVFEKRVTAQDVANRVDIRAPQNGVVHELAVHTHGGVIAAGETLMLIVPGNDELIVESRVQPQEIDQVHLGADAVLRFANLNQRTTLEIVGQVVRIGADVSRQDKAGAAYFLVRVAIPRSMLADLDGARLRPGMPAEVFIRTGERTLLSYLMRPVSDQVRRAFRER